MNKTSDPITNLVLGWMQRNWIGPAIDIVVGDRRQLIGQGVSRTTITFQKATLRRMFGRSSLVFGEAFVSGDVRIDGDFRDVFAGFFQTQRAFMATRLGRILAMLERPQSPTSVSKGVQQARHHYDIGNDFYRLWLDPSLVYTCAYFLSDDDTLERAQRQKLELVCRKARLRPGDSLLDIGCGWGALLFHAVEKHGAEKATGLTAANEQADYAEAEAQRRGLAHKVKVIRGDWRELGARNEKYDRVVSVGLLEQVGQAQYAEFYRLCAKLLAPDGVSVVHTIASSLGGSEPWFEKYIFPGMWLPTLDELAKHATGADFVTVDVENLWQHYAKTLACWYRNFQAHRDSVVSMYDERFARMWEYYLLSTESGFSCGNLHLIQQVLIKDKTAPWPLNRELDLLPENEEETEQD